MSTGHVQLSHFQIHRGGHVDRLSRFQIHRRDLRVRFLLQSSGPVAHRGPPHLPPPPQARAAERATPAALGASVCEWGASRDGSPALAQGGTGPMPDAMAQQGVASSAP